MLKADEQSTKPDRPAEVAGVLLGQAVDLICACEDGSNQDDFRTEFYSYWNRDLDESHGSDLQPVTPQRPQQARRDTMAGTIQVW